MTSKVMERVPVPDWKTGWEVSTILEALRECYPQQVYVMFVDNRELTTRVKDEQAERSVCTVQNMG